MISTSAAKTQSGVEISETKAKENPVSTTYAAHTKRSVITGWRRKKRTIGHRRLSKTSFSEGVVVADISQAYVSGGTHPRAPKE
ncbi:hypothetical protein GCM10027027_15980 [Neomicrococcus lactis]